MKMARNMTFMVISYLSACLTFALLITQVSSEIRVSIFVPVAICVIDFVNFLVASKRFKINKIRKDNYNRIKILLIITIASTIVCATLPYLETTI